MQNDAKKLIELATIDLLYAQSEVRCGDQENEAMKRIAMHLDAIAGHLDGLTNVLQIAAVDHSQPDGKAAQRIAANLGREHRFGEDQRVKLTLRSAC